MISKILIFQVLKTYKIYTVVEIGRRNEILDYLKKKKTLTNKKKYFLRMINSLYRFLIEKKFYLNLNYKIYTSDQVKCKTFAFKIEI